MNSELKRLIKYAQTFGPAGATFKLSKGQTLSHVVKKWNAENPQRRINLKSLIEANGMLDPKKYAAGRTYKMPSSAIEKNNPGNVRFYNQKWLGEIADGLNRGDFSVFDTPEHGARAAARTVMNIAGGLENPTIDGVVAQYSPKGENNVSRHAKNISSISGIPRTATLRTGDDGQMVDLLRGLIGAETGSRYSFSPEQMTNIVRSARQSK